MDSNKILLGKIKEIHQYKVILSLPHNKIGACSLTDVSSKYKSLLESITKENEVEDECEINVPSLSDIFVVGQTVHAKMIKSSSNKINVSLVPSDTNENINLNHIKSGMELQVAIQSCEDKGYILETGIKGMNGFLPFDKCLNSKFLIGQLIHAFPIITGSKKNAEGHSRVVNFTTINEKFKSIKQSASNPTDFSCILPGMLLNVHLKLSNDGTLEGSYQGFPVSVKYDHQLMSELKTPDQVVCVIEIDCTLKQLDCSLLPHLLPPYSGAQELLSFKIGHSEPNCAAIKIQKNQQTFKIPCLEYARGIIRSNHIDPTLSDMKVGDTATIRFLDFNFVDNVVQATTLKKLLSLSYFSVHQAKLGEIIKGKVKGFQKSGFSVQISSLLSGVIPVHHLRESESKAPSSAYKSGDDIRCRVFHIDYDMNKLVLTVKKSFMDSALPVFESIDELQSGALLDGFVAKVSEHGMLVVMFGNMKGWVRKSEIPQSGDKNLSVMFKRGDAVTVRVLKCEKDKGRIMLTMLDPTEEKDDDTTQDNVTVEVGQMYDCIVKKPMKSGFNVRLLPMNKAAFITYEQLSDSRDHCALLRAHYAGCENKEIRTTVVVVNVDNATVAVSKKRSLINAASDGRILRKTEDVTVGSQWLGWVAKKETFGVFVELPSGVAGLLPNRNVSDSKSVNSALLEVGDTVDVKVVEFDPAKPKKSLFTIKMSDTYRAKEHLERDTLTFLSNHLEERKLIKSLPGCEKVGKYEIGDVVDAIVTSQLEWGFTVSVGESVPGFVRNHHLPKEVLTVGITHRAVIIDIDLAQQSLEVCMTGSVVNSVQHRNTANKIQLKQVIKSDVLVFNADFVVAMLLDHGHGNIVYIPTKRFWNDIGKDLCWIVNQRNLTVVKRALSATQFIGSLKINEPIEQLESGKKKQETAPPMSLKRMESKVRLSVGLQYHVFYAHVKKLRVFFSVAKRTKCVCNVIEFSNSLDKIEQLLLCPPSLNSVMEDKITITETGRHGSGIACGHFLRKEIIEKGDQICGRVTAVVKNRECAVELPFKSHGVVYLTKNTEIVPKMGSVIECRVEEVESVNNKPVYVLSVLKVSRLADDTAVDVMDIDTVKIEEITKERKRKVRQVEGEMPLMVVTKKTELTNQNSIDEIYKSLHQSDDEDDENEDDDSERPTKKLKLNTQSQAERELTIREAEQRRESGDNLKNPKTEAEFELLIFNYPTLASSWIRYMDHILLSEGDVAKARSVAERAISTLNGRDVENRFSVLLKYVDLELDQLAQNRDSEDQEEQMKKFQMLFERCLTQKAKSGYIHVCERSRSLKMYDLAEKLAKKFVKDFHGDCMAWFELAVVRFEQRKFAVVKETLTNAERMLKADQFRELQIKMAKLEMESGSKSRGEKILKGLMEARPKDASLAKKCKEILTKAGISEHIEGSESEMEH